MTKQEMLYEMARNTKTNNGMLVRSGKAAYELDALAKKNTVAKVTDAYNKYLQDKSHALIFINELRKRG